MTVNMYNDLEALETAVEIERRGEVFYHSVQKWVENEQAKAVLSYLEEREREHALIFRRLYEEALKKKNDFDDSYLFDPEVSAYLKAMVASVVFPGEKEQQEIISSIKGMDDVLRLGMQVEKDSILLYAQLSTVSKLEEARETFQRLVEEEKKHLIELQEMKTKGYR